ncbi:sigma-54-dependent transcriptional regulator [Deminuibacter soli]|uniref:Sigma-54-dependent Fis family transcriptional regulator n=1 Tax=Deminuibacter soli TaxID=2291815 RepID=A0A3E1NNC3_9BACT|nr:sigma-54 dependent transcriptional regulator [Deminuibacter soli]RFM29439.1 sigma-54-dependent Fis family transcriptional regulator [Deminuibacter soli]
MQQEIFTIFIVEDDLFYGSMLEHMVALNPDYQVKKFTSAASFKQALHEKPHVVTLDYSLPDTTGDELLAMIREISPDTKTIMISGQEDIQVAIDALKKGAHDYIVKNDEAKDRLWIALQNLHENFGLQQQLNSLKDEVARKYNFKNIIGTSPAIKKVFDLVDKASRTNITASITGETGTGKELVAKAIHFNSIRKAKPFVAVNIAAIPGDLIESELFGHEKGAFTGAVVRRTGKFEEANKGTLFLDEIGELNINLQAKLLRVLQEKEFSRLGSNDLLTTDVRIIVATHRNLAHEVKRGRFREDLYYRLLGLPIHLPPLRERGHDILLIAKYFLEQFCRENDMPVKKLSVEAKMKLMTFPFPGNIRQLKSMMELACVLSDGDEIAPVHLDTGAAPATEMAAGAGDHLTLKQYTTRIIQQYLDNNDADVLKVAALLDVGKSTIYRMISKNEVVLHKNKIVHHG